MKAFSGAVWLLVVLLLVRNTSSDLNIQLSSLYGNDNETHEYTDYFPFRIQYANIPSTNFQGLLHQPQPSDGCSYVEPLPDSAMSSNLSWIAVVNNYSKCIEDMVINVRNAGYELIVAYSADDVRMSVTNYILNSGFGVVVISNKFYMDTLSDYLISNVSDVPDSSIVATIDGNALLTPAMMTSIFFILSFCCCSAVCCCIVCRRRRHEHDLAGQLAEIEGRRRNFERVQRQERIARQELIESILRQLQELHIDSRSQLPLGRDETRKLPTRKYRSGEEKIERCAICVEDFKDGDVMRVLPCEHSFHKQCIDEWLNNHSAVCPLCKFEVPRGGEPAPAPPPHQQPPLILEDDRSLPSADNDSPLIVVSTSLQRNSARRNYGSV